MASTMVDTKSCSVCGTKQWLIPCDGCRQSFCYNHIPQHRIFLSRELDTIEEKYRHLQRIYEQYEKCQEHPLFSTIDVWEHDAVIKIKNTAENLRCELRRIHDDSNARMKAVLNAFHEELCNEREQDGYTEIKLEQLKEKLINIKKQLETPCDIELIPDNDSLPIYLMKINATTLNLLSSTASIEVPISNEEDTDLMKCSLHDDNELINTQPTTVDIIEESCTTCSNSTNPSVELKETIDKSPTTCDTISLEFQNLLDPTKHQDFLFLQLSSTVPSLVPEIFKQLINRDLQNYDKEELFVSQLDVCEQAVTFINTSDVSFEEQNCLVNKISEMNTVYCIYIHGKPFEDDDQRSDFFRRYSKIKAMFENEQRLMVQWALDTVNQYKRTGDMYVESGDKDKGRICFQSGIDLYQNLSKFFNEKRRVR